VVVAVITVPVVQLSFMYEVRVVTVRNTIIPVPSVIPVASCVCAVCRILGAHRQLMFVVVVAVRRMKMSVMKVICVPLVTNRGVSAILAVSMCMALMRVAVHFPPFLTLVEKSVG